MIRVLAVPAAVLGAWALIAGAWLATALVVAAAMILPVGVVGRIAGVW